MLDLSGMKRGDVLGIGFRTTTTGIWGPVRALLKLQTGFCSSGFSEMSASEGMGRVRPYDQQTHTFTLLHCLLWFCAFFFLLHYLLHFSMLARSDTFIFMF